MKHRSIQSTHKPKGYTGKDFNKWINYIFKQVKSNKP